MPVRRGSLVCMMIVVPAFPIGDQANDPVVAAVVLRFVISVAPDVGHRIDAPSDMPVQNRPYKNSPDQQAGTELNTTPNIPGGNTNQEASDRVQHGDSDVDLEPVRAAFKIHVERILEQIPGEPLVVVDVRELPVFKHQPSKMSPEECHQRTVRIGLMVGVLVMNSVHRHPTCRGVLHGAHTQKGQQSLEPLRCRHATVGEHAVVADVDTQCSEDIQTQDAQGDSRPTEEPGDKGDAGEQMDQRNGNSISPTHLHWLDGLLRPSQWLAGVGRQDFRLARCCCIGRTRRRMDQVSWLAIGRLMDRHGHPKLGKLPESAMEPKWFLKTVWPFSIT